MFMSVYNENKRKPLSVFPYKTDEICPESLVERGIFPYYSTFTFTMLFYQRVHLEKLAWLLWIKIMKISLDRSETNHHIQVFVLRIDLIKRK